MKKTLALILIGLLIAPNAYGARLDTKGYELNSTTDQMEFTLNSTVTVSTTQKRTGSYAGRVNGSTGFWRQHVASTNQTITGYLSVCVYVVSAPNATTQLVRFSSTANASVGNISMLTDRTLVLLQSGGAQIGSPSTAVALNTWTCIELANDSSTSPGTLTGRIQEDGAGSWTTFATGANSNQGSWARALWGNITGAQSTNDMYFDDIKINNSSGGSQNSFPDNGKVIYLRPNATGDANAWTRAGADSGANWSQNEEVPPNDATDYITSTTANQEDLYNMTDSGINSYDTVNVVQASVRYSASSTTNVPGFKVEIEKTSGGTISQGTEITSNSTSWLTNANSIPENPTLTLYLDPDSSAWTSSTLDSMQSGVKITTDNTNTAYVSALWVAVDYTPGTAPTAGASVEDDFIIITE
jgi:hypothetical protein